MCVRAGHDRATSRPLSDHEEWDRALAASGPAPIVNLHDEHAHHGKTSISGRSQGYLLTDIATPSQST